MSKTGIQTNASLLEWNSWEEAVIYSRAWQRSFTNFEKELCGKLEELHRKYTLPKHQSTVQILQQAAEYGLTPAIVKGEYSEVNDDGHEEKKETKKKMNDDRS